MSFTTQQISMRETLKLRQLGEVESYEIESNGSKLLKKRETFSKNTTDNSPLYRKRAKGKRRNLITTSEEELERQ